MLPRLDQRQRSIAQLIFSTAIVLEGLLLGVAFFAFLPNDSIVLRSLVLIWIAGTAAHVIGAYALMPEAAVGFLLIQILPILIYLLITSGRFRQLVAIGGFVFSRR